MNNKSNIRSELWEEGITTPEEYEARLYFYGHLNKAGKGSLEHMDFKDEVICKVEEVQDGSSNYLNYCKSGREVKIDDFGWKVGYDREMVDYLNNGIDALKI